MKKIVLATVACGVLAATASAQQASTYTFERKAATEAQQVLLDKVRVEARQILPSKSVPNAPYSAEATNESIQVLQDGNRIVKRTATRVYRDSAGRTRQETLDDNGRVKMISVSDPVSGTSFMFDPSGSTVSNSTLRVRKVPGEAVTASGQGSSVVVATADKQRREAEVGAQVTARERTPVVVAGTAAAGGILYAPAVKGETTKEDLGQQSIEGVNATGTRTTTVIPAGAIGNEQPIRIVSEEWFSPELQVLVLTRHSDPRTGETTYRLTGINRTEPPATLFETPVKK